MQTPPTPPQVSQTPAPLGPAEAQVLAPSGPTTMRELEALRSRRTELSSQLISSAKRREGLMRELSRAPAGTARTGIEGRIGVLDKRIFQIETDIAETGRQLTSSQAGLLTATEQPPIVGGLSARNITTISNVFIIFVLAPLAIAAARNMWRKGNRAPASPPDAENARKLEQLQQSIDTIALEVQRVSEGQRFVTKLMSEQVKVSAIGATSSPDGTVINATLVNR